MDVLNFFLLITPFIFFLSFSFKFYSFLSNFPHHPGSEAYEVADSDSVEPLNRRLGELPDRLSELPDSLILKILSSLPTRDVVRTTVLSKRWKDIWTTVPSLRFLGETRSFICGTLAKWKGPKILSFVIALDDFPTSDILDSWLLLPIEKQVEVLFVYLRSHMVPEYFAPQRLYSCSSISYLSLDYCNLKIEENVNVQWTQLTSLKIQHPSYLSQHTMNRILSGAPLLEELVLWSLEISENLDIRSSSLKILEIGGEDYFCSRTVVKAMLRIWAPNLLSLEISGCVYATCSLHVPSLTSATLVFEELHGYEVFPPLEMFDQVFRSIRHVEELALSDLSIQLLLKMKEIYMVAQFSNTKLLKIFPAEANRLLDVLGMFPELTMLDVVIDENEMFLPDPHYNLTLQHDDPDLAMLLDAYVTLPSKKSFPNPSLLQLKTVDITWPIHCANIIPMTKILLENAPMLEKMDLQLVMDRAEPKTFDFVKELVFSMSRSSPTAQVIISKF